ncbi:hypothetical protein F2Q69_00046894 [Brassica cretica]|uniref:Uncharacterized protein n=1 Tax=Brassica cretica TaxID=69181 RepID=A0A8S9Q1E1_BRACR|nr:hypothetical protein F2Q69_00046894 [Brassica cretica]
MDPSLPPPFTAFPPFTNSNPFPPPQHPVYGAPLTPRPSRRLTTTSSFNHRRQFLLIHLLTTLITSKFRTPFLTKKILPYQGVVAWVLTALSSHGKPEMNSFGLFSARLWNTDW